MANGEFLASFPGDSRHGAGKADEIAELRRQVARFRSFAETSAHWLWESDAEGRLTYLAENVLEVFGYQARELLGKTRRDIYIDDDDEAREAAALIDSSIREGKPFRDLLLPHRHHDGQRLFVLLSGQPKYHADGTLAGAIGGGRNVTHEERTKHELEQANEQFVALSRLLKENEQRFRDFAKVSSDWAWETDAKGRFTFISSGMERITGIPKSAFLGFTLRQALRSFPEAEKLLDRLKSAVGDRQQYHEVVLPLRQASGETLHVSLSGQSVLDDEDRCVGYRGTGRDITEVVRSRQALAQESALLSAILDNLGQGIALFDADARLRAWNPSLARMLNYPVGLLREGMAWLLLQQFHAERGDFGDRPDTAAAGGPAPGDTANPQPPGEWQLADGTFLERRRNPMPDGGFVDTFTDVTELRSKETQLRHAQKMEAIGHLTGGVAHEFNNLLTVIGGFARRAERRADDVGHVTECLTEVISAADRAAELTQQMLAFSRKQANTPEPLRLEEATSSYARMLGPLLEGNAELTVDTSGTRGVVLLDRGQLTQIVINLAVNARDAMQPGGRISLVAKDVDLPADFVASHLGRGGGAYCHVSLTDTGSGMDENVLKHLFEPFFTTKEQGKGTGLGLAVVYGIVEQSAGMIDVASTPGKGTTFSLYFPLVTEPPTAATDDATRATTAVFPQHCETTILLAEDEPAVRRLVAGELRGLGFAVLEAEDGAHALRLAAASEHAIELLLTDVAMPRMGGIEAAETLVQRQPGIKVVYMTGYATQAEKSELPHALAILRKPFTEIDLRQALEQVLTAPGV